MNKNILAKWNAGVAACMMVMGLCGLSACVNNIPGEDDGKGTEPVAERKVVVFSAEIAAEATRMIDNKFQVGDKIGLFAVLPTGSLENDRYADNLMLEYQSDGTLVAQQPLYYPEDDAPMELYCYYPYQKEGIAAGSTLLPVAVATDQQTDDSFAQSDFLVARVTGVTATSAPVKLSFYHKLSHIKVSLTPPSGMSAEDLVALKPRLVALNFQTEGMYDPTTDKFSNLGGVRDIVAHGTWNESGGKVAGKEIIVLPQAIGGDERNLAVEVDGRTYTTTIDDKTLTGGGSFSFDIKLELAADGTIDGITGEVEGWTESGRTSVGTTTTTGGVHTALFSFEESNAYRVYHEGEAVAEVWREYLCTGNGSGVQALVAYPFKDGTCDLQNGLLLREYGSTASTCGGKIAWKTIGTGFNRTDGNQPPIETFYVNSNHELSTDPTDGVEVSVNCYRLTDRRDEDNVQHYQLVKIGTQIWMAENLRAESFADGTPLTEETIIGSDKDECYYKVDGKPIYFYNGETLMNASHTMAPKGFRIPTEDDWSLMRTYLYDDATVVKTDEGYEWKQAKDTDKPVTAATNLTWFGAAPVGVWSNGLWFADQLAAFWSWDASGSNKPATYLVTLYGEETTFIVNDMTSFLSNKEVQCYQAASVRCIKE